MQCKDIPDITYLTAVSRSPGIGSSEWRMRWDVHAELQSMIRRPVPEKLFMAKTRRLVARGLLGGCPCGCRGDLHLPHECADQVHCCRPVQ